MPHFSFTASVIRVVVGARMEHDFPGAVPEIPVSDVGTAAAYYKNQLGFSIDWSSEDGGIAGISKGSCRMFLTNRAFREHYGIAAPVLVWLTSIANKK